MLFFKQKTAYEMRISDWSSDVCSSDLYAVAGARTEHDDRRGGDRGGAWAGDPRPGRDRVGDRRGAAGACRAGGCYHRHGDSGTGGVRGGDVADPAAGGGGGGGDRRDRACRAPESEEGRVGEECVSRG